MIYNERKKLKQSGSAYSPDGSVEKAENDNALRNREESVTGYSGTILSGVIALIAPFVITYISMKISRHREAKLQPYLDEIMKKNEEKNKDINY